MIRIILLEECLSSFPALINPADSQGLLTCLQFSLLFTSLNSPVAVLGYLVFGFRFACENKWQEQLKCLFIPPSGVRSFQNKSHSTAQGLNLGIRWIIREDPRVGCSFAQNKQTSALILWGRRPRRWYFGEGGPVQGAGKWYSLKVGSLCIPREGE